MSDIQNLAPVPSGEDVSTAIMQMNREPFRAELAKVLGCSPTVEALQDFANKSPDRWAQALSILGKLAGYSEKHIHEHNVNLNVKTMSDAALEERLQALEKKETLIRAQLGWKAEATDADFKAVESI
jgi:hypothetical protein